jgi:hypothetical protein
MERAPFEVLTTQLQMKYFGNRIITYTLIRGIDLNFCEI